MKVRELGAGLLRRHLWILSMLVLTAAFALLRGSRRVMNAVASLTLWIKQGLAWLLSPLPFSAAEVLCAAALLAALVWLAVSAVQIVRARGERLRLFYRRFSLALAVLVTLYAALCLFLGASYYSDGFQEKSGLYARKSSVEELYQTTAYFARELSVWSWQVERDENGLFAEPLDGVFAATPEIYENVCGQYPFLGQLSPRPKRVLLSRLMSYFNYTGFYFPFTGEANINVDEPAAFLPSTVAHEMAHQRGVASEQEANFVAVLACLKSGNAAYAYSGSLLAFTHLGNSLYRRDAEAYRRLYAALPENVKADILANNAYWAQYETKAAEVTSTVYDGLLKSYGQELGVQSYGACVDLLIAYYEAYGGFA